MTTSSIAREGARKGDLAAIHIAKKQLQLNDDEYRDIMATVCGGVRSAGSLDFTGRQRFRAHLEDCLRRQRADQTSARVQRRPLTEQQRLMWSLWMQLADAGLVRERKMSAIVSYARRQTGVERLEWLNKQQEDLVIASMKGWLKRAPASDDTP